MDDNRMDAGKKDQQPEQFQKTRQCGRGAGVARPVARRWRKKGDAASTAALPVMVLRLASGTADIATAIEVGRRQLSGRNSADC